MSLNSIEHWQMKDPSAAGRCKRWHTWDYINQQRVDSHSWNVARLLLAFWPDCRKELLVEALMHDTGERVAGDAPYPLKATDPELKQRIDKVERNARLNMAIPWGLPAPQILDDLERRVLKLCDMFDMLEWSMLELEMGNKHAELVKIRCMAAIDGMLRELGDEKIRERAFSYRGRRNTHHLNLMRGEA